VMLLELVVMMLGLVVLLFELVVLLSELVVLLLELVDVEEDRLELVVDLRLVVAGVDEGIL
jgi:hypothetical protein